MIIEFDEKIKEDGTYVRFFIVNTDENSKSGSI